jgi:ATP-dependent Clp protease ATP-binding subunit ClpC
MFELLTDDARSVLVLAQQEARLLSHGYIGTEHLLLGLIAEERGVAAQLLDGLGVHLDALRIQVEVLVGQGDQRPSGHLPFTPNAEGVLQLSSRIAATFSDTWIGTEHLLLAIIGGQENSAIRALRVSNLDLDTLRVVLLAKATSGERVSQHAGPLLDPER